MSLSIKTLHQRACLNWKHSHVGWIDYRCKDCGRFIKRGRTRTREFCEKHWRIRYNARKLSEYYRRQINANLR